MEKLKAAELDKNFLSFFRNRKLKTVFTRALQWPLLWTRQVQTTSTLYFPLLYTGLVNRPFPLCFPTKTLHAYFFPPMCAIFPPISSSLIFSRNVWRGIQIAKLVITNLFPTNSYLSSLIACNFIEENNIPL